MSTKVTVTIETDAGPETTVLTLKGEEGGDNPRYNAQNVERALGKIAQRVRGMYVGMYGNQY